MALVYVCARTISIRMLSVFSLCVRSVLRAKYHPQPPQKFKMLTAVYAADVNESYKLYNKYDTYVIYIAIERKVTERALRKQAAKVAEIEKKREKAHKKKETKI